MACIEHTCPSCGWVEINNLPTVRCSKCGTVMDAYFDEEGDDEWYDADLDDLEWEDVDEW